jgi:hypothetical protein
MAPLVPTANFWENTFLNYSKLNYSDQHTNFYMLMDYVSHILNFQKWNCYGAVAKIKFEFFSCQKRSSCTVVNDCQ